MDSSRLAEVIDRCDSNQTRLRNLTTKLLILRDIGACGTYFWIIVQLGVPSILKTSEPADQNNWIDVKVLARVRSRRIASVIVARVVHMNLLVDVLEITVQYLGNVDLLSIAVIVCARRITC